MGSLLLSSGYHSKRTMALHQTRPRGAPCAPAACACASHPSSGGSPPADTREMLVHSQLDPPSLGCPLRSSTGWHQLSRSACSCPRRQGAGAWAAVLGSGGHLSPGQPTWHPHCAISRRLTSRHVVSALGTPSDSQGERPNAGPSSPSSSLQQAYSYTLMDSDGRLLGMATKPSPLLTAHEAVVAQLEALKAVYHPCGDLQLSQIPYGLEVLYNFAAIDPFNKGSTYFGKRLNVAYFSQFSAKFSLREFRPLLGMRSYTIASSLHVSQTRFTARVQVPPSSSNGCPATFVFTLAKADSGHVKGCWVTQSLRRVEEDDSLGS